MGEKLAKKVLVIGWDAGDWKVIKPLLDAGKMPTLKKMMSEGVSGNLKTLEPPFSPMLWTSIATGVRPDKHGILGFTEPDSATGSVRPVSSTSRKVKAIWNILTQNKYKTNLIGWWPSHPAEPINGVCVSNHYQRAPKRIHEDWIMADNTVHPKEMEDVFKALRVHPDEFTEQHILPFVPNAAKIDQEKDQRLVSLSKILADTATINSAATYAMENTEWDFMGVYFDGIDHFCHGFMKFHPPKLHESLPEDLYENYKDVINGAYMFHDMMLEQHLKLAGEDATVLLISDHGFHSDHLRPINLPKEEPAAPALEHRPYGIFCIKGPGIKKNETIGGATLLDICPTLLTLFGLPVGEDMDGNPLLQIFEKEIESERIESWEKIEGDAGMHPKDQQEDPYAAQEALKQLVELGYIEDPGEDKEKAVEQVKMHAQYNLSRVYLGSNRPEKALPILETIVKDNPENSRFVLRLASCYHQLNKIEECKGLIDDIRRLEREKKEKAREQLKDKIKKAEESGRVEKGKLEEIEGNMKEIEDSTTLNLLEGNILLAENKPKLALECFKKAELSVADQPKLHIQIGRGYLQIRKWKQAEKSFKKALTLDPENPSAYHGLGVSYLRQENYEDAIDSLLDTINLNYNFAFAHYHLGEVLIAVNEFESAAQAFEVCLSMAPNISKARNYLIDLYENKLNTPEKITKRLTEEVLPPNEIEQEKLKDDYAVSEYEEKANEQKNLINEKSKGTITVVSGLPRSGTSMMMQILRNGGMEIYSDGEREADENNPKGYYEHENVKKLIRNKKWLEEVDDKAVKIIAQLLFHLPPRYNYKIIFMLRNLQDVVISQNKMLVKLGKSKEGVYPVGLEEQFKKTLDKVKAWQKKNYNVDIHFVQYEEAINNPKAIINSVNKFLNNKLDESKMIEVIDESLYHNK